MEKNIKIAIADDHNVSIEGITTILNCLDYAEVVFVASNGKEVIEKLETIVPDIILMDVQMPIMDGIEATKEITRCYPQIKVIGISYFSDQIPYIQSMINAGAKGFVSKNINIKNINDMITNILNGEIYFSPDVSALIFRSQQNIFDKTKWDNKKIKTHFTSFIEDSDRKQNFRNDIPHQGQIFGLQYRHNAPSQYVAQESFKTKGKV